MLLLHFPNWRKISDIKDQDTSWTDKFNFFFQTAICPNFVKAEVKRAKKHDTHEIEEEFEVEESHENDVEQPEWMDALRPTACYDAVPYEFHYDDGGPGYNWNQRSLLQQDVGKSWIEHIKENSNEPNNVLDVPNVVLTNMNEDQRLAFNIVMDTLHRYIDEDNAFKPLRMVVSGTAGSGKSYLIKCLVKGIRNLFKTNRAVQILCPTGSSANLISGVTLHSFLKIPTHHKGKEMKQPDGKIGKLLQENCRGVEVLLVDERSLIGATTLGWMEFMCRCAMYSGSKSQETWGGLPVVVFLGDDVQLPPVLDSPVYNCKSKVPAAMHGVLVWKEFDRVVHLQNIIRQSQSEKHLRELLSALREYQASPVQAQWLQQFQWNNLRTRYGNELLQSMSEEGLFVFPTHEEEWQHNKCQILKVNAQHPIAKCKAITKGPHSKFGNVTAGGLLDTVFISRDAKVMLSVNLCVSFGLFNGAMGKVMDIVYLDGKQPSDSLPDVVMVEFPSYTGPPFLKENNKVIPVVPVTRQLDCGCFSCKREQIPLRLGWATTIHKCQGMTIGTGEPNRFIVINPGTRSFESRNPGALFVALSRAKSSGAVEGTYPDFAWHPAVLINEDRICHVVRTATTSARANEIHRLTQIAQGTKQIFSSLKDDNSFLRHFSEE
ncbi:ATP-dependent DNA helicase PIF1-like [Mizuhopecten yessoensis]|uniref:ATP-dependent DNA helicase PIF1-like n=1 Tax=Mizuhopecten yessoensis TaxID=6573 RepID=UPI000B458B5F|nr:ATP-dependent DNA helicase PIF1-like [Mizuhopecten yessoensis]